MAASIVDHHYVPAVPVSQTELPTIDYLVHSGINSEVNI